MNPVRPFGDILPALGRDVYVDPAACVIGRVRLGDEASVWPGTVIRGDVNDITIGARTNLQDGCICHVASASDERPGGIPLVVGADVTVGHGVILHACRVGDRCLIGMGSVIMDGAVLEDDVLLGAGSLVPPGKRLAAASLYHGRPVKRVRALEPGEIRALAESAAHYVRLSRRYVSNRRAGPR